MEMEKINQVLIYISTNNITELNELFYIAAKLVCKKIGTPLKKHEENIKTRMGNSTGNTDKNIYENEPK